MELTMVLMEMMAALLLVVDRLAVPDVYAVVDQRSGELCLMLRVDEIEWWMMIATWKWREM